MRVRERLERWNWEGGKGEFWGHVVKIGARGERHHNNEKPSKEIVQKLIEKNRVELDIQNEMAKQDKNFHDTTAGKTLEPELAQEHERLERRVYAPSFTFPVTAFPDSS